MWSYTLITITAVGELGKVASWQDQIWRRITGVTVWICKSVRFNRHALCASGCISLQSQPFSQHSCWLPFWGTADICLLSPSDTLLGTGLWHFWLCVCLCVCVFFLGGGGGDELLGYAPLTFYWMLIVFIAMAAGGEAAIPVCKWRLSVTCKRVHVRSWRLFVDELACLLFAGERVCVGVYAGRQWSSVLPCMRVWRAGR